MRRVLLVALLGAFFSCVSGASASAGFGISSYSIEFVDTTGNPVTQAGAHPDMVTTLGFNTTPAPEDPTRLDMNGQVKDIEVDLPTGFYGNPSGMPSCKLADVVATNGFCNPAAQVGTLYYAIAAGGATVRLNYPVYNMESPDDQTAELAVVATSIPAKLVITNRPEGKGLRARFSSLNQGLSLQDTKLVLWGVPADPAHDSLRQGSGGIFDAPTKAGVGPAPFLSLPARCGAATTTLRADSWQNPGVFDERSVTTNLVGCEQLHFGASFTADPASRRAGDGSGLHVGIDVPQDVSVTGLATPTLKKVNVALPIGVSINPSAADGLGACTDAQFAVSTLDPPGCPASSKIGTTEVQTHLLPQHLHGGIYLGEPLDQSLAGVQNGDMFRGFLDLAGKGVQIKLKGKITTDPITGQISASFDDNPQLPFTHLDVDFKGGSRSPLALPKQCGTYTTQATFTPWSGGPPVQATDHFTLDQSCDQAGKFEPTLSAGVGDPRAGGSSPFVFDLKRPNGQQDFEAVQVTLPQGLLAYVGGVPLCPELQAATGSCSSASQVGTVRAAAGAGPAPLQIPQPGKAPTAVFLAGPYRGAPFSLSIVVPAQAGPYDLGTVVVRAALFVDRTDAHVTVSSDPLPTMLKGIPLDLQQMTVTVDRPGFMINPTSCDPARVTADVKSTAGASVGLLTPFSIRACSLLGFKPKLTMALTGRGQTTDGKHPALTAKLTTRGADANIAQATVMLPLSLALDPDNANGLCEPKDAAAHACPARSIVGHANATTILAHPVSGPIYFVRGERIDGKGRVRRTLPKLYIPLTGPDGVNVDLNASSEVVGDHLVTTFDNVPDARVSSFELKIDGGKHGILVVSNADICRRAQVTQSSFAGQNGKVSEPDITVSTSGACRLKVVKTSHSGRALNVTVAGVSAGKVVVSGRGVLTHARMVSASPVATLTVPLTASARRSLTAGRDVRINFTAAYTARGSKKATTIHKTVVVHAAGKSRAAT
jgi:hypothetical protein